MAGNMKEMVMAAHRTTIEQELMHHLLNSAADFPKQIYNFVHWLSATDFKLYKKINFHDYNKHPDLMGYGLKANENIREGSRILNVPLNMALKSTHFIKEDSEQRGIMYQNMCEEAVKILGNIPEEGKVKFRHVLQLQGYIIGLARDDNPKYTPLVDTWPITDLTQPVFWDEGILGEVDSRNVIESQKVHSEIVENLYGALIRTKEYKELEYDWTASEFHWSYHVFQSRQTVQHGADWTHPDYTMLMVPLIEFINHSFHPNCAIEPSTQPTEYLMQLTALKDINVGEQLLITYGDFANIQIINKYGFAIPNNPNNMIILRLDKFGEFANIFNIESEKKYYLIMKLGLGSIDSERFYPNKISPNLIKKLRILFLSNEDFEKKSVEEFKIEDFSVKSVHDKLIIEYIIEVLKDNLSRVDKNYLELREGLGEIETLQDFHMRNLYILLEDEQYILKNNIPNIHKILVPTI